jgi:L-seryl-tRNA(Ser) seleniumtransferase
LRNGEPCVVARIEHDRCLLDLRCLPGDSDADVVKAVLAI